MSDAPTRLYLVRHGRVHNPNELAYGHLPRFRLADEGRGGAERAGAWLAGRGVVALYVSPLLRARQTARMIRAAVGDLPLHTARDLRESELARFWQGTPWQEIAILYPELYEQFITTPGQVTTGETMAAMAARVRRVCRRAERRYPGQAVALVSHRDPILALRLSVEPGRSHDDLQRTRCEPASITALDLDGRQLTFIEYVEP